MDNILPAPAVKPKTEKSTDLHQGFRQHFDGSVLWDYRSDQSAQTYTCIRLVKLSEKKRWNPYTDIDWSHEIPDDRFPYSRDADLFCGFDEYDRLPRQERNQICRQHHGMEISEILHGEQLAMMCASQLVSLMPCMESRLFASRQAADEARHVEFFRRYLACTGMEVYPPGPGLRQLASEALQSPQWEIKLLICQILIESLALAHFASLLDTHTQPLLQHGLRRIMDDEARHVKFGTGYLKSLFRHHDPGQLERYGHFVVDKAFELASSDNHGIAIAETRHWDVHKLRHHLRRQRIARPRLFQRRFRQLSLNIRAAGLMNSSIEERLHRFTCA